ncbi:phosphoribosyl-AMP cyclohydrolase [Erythrobacter sp. YT30]|uniref:phosphoribosyl-AMP cyclohydrolase n=1 Tax=Erythrobacter sp. YT30 TaxID=1735012 RepID=UPI00076D2726|nr:phosphoribosyl-AMP cyclohydrolase [Erythrobacter sp. YT30]KWV92939.1 phosphoribosyl-AMP cyclohydrolase [Erythrobacter sp. YT30]
MTQSNEITKEAREEGSAFLPMFDAQGLLTAVVIDTKTKEVLVVAFMNDASLRLTLETGEVHFWSRSRARLWKKGETSGNVLKVVEIRVDCDQDALVIFAEPAGPTCHTGRPSCFYRQVNSSDEGTPTLVKVKT